MRSLDCETDGLDVRHNARPFFVTICDEDYNLKYWEWSVDPLTRIPLIPEKDKQEIRDEINNEPEGFVLQNGKFDTAALNSIGIFNESCQWNWDTTYDTLLAGHLLASNQPHDLTTMTLVELGINIKGYEEALRDAVNEARRMARSKYPDWKIAKRGLEGMPSAKEAVWHYDMWLPRAIAKHENYQEDHPWWTVLQEYSNADSSVTLPLLKKQLEKIEARGLTKIYEYRRKLLPIVYEMESNPVTGSKRRTHELKSQYGKTSGNSHRICINVAGGSEVIDQLPINGTSNALKEVIFNQFKLVSSRKTKKDNDSLDKFQLDEWIENLPPKSKAFAFIKHLRAYRRRRTALSYIEAYESYWLPAETEDADSWFNLFPSLNCVGTKTLRWSSQNPNSQQISKNDIEEILDGGEVSSHNARYMFGPLPGEEWWSCDAQNIELRLPAYKAGEQLMIDLFERPNDPPYYGSNHLLAFDTLHPEKFKEHGKAVKKVYADSWYQWVKNGNFAVQYGAMASSGTADRAYHVKGAQAIIESRLGKIKKLSEEQIQYAEKYGYVETMPDKTVDPTKGYPLLCTRTKWGKILPTVPLSYYIQGSAMWWMMKAMIRVREFLIELNRNDLLFRKLVGRLRTTAERERGYRMLMQVHDELVFCFPKGCHREQHQTNLPIMKEIKRLMALGGDDFGIPTPVGLEFHPDSWGTGVTV